jgi:integrase/recombinase XerD
MTYKESLTAYLQQRYAPHTAKEYAREINIYLSNYPAAQQAMHKDIAAYAGLLRQRYSNSRTIVKIVASIKVYYAYLCHEGVRSDNPCNSLRIRGKGRKAIQLQDLFTSEELEALLHRPQRFKTLAVRGEVIMGLLVYQGLKPSEIAALTVTDINLSTGSIYIKASPSSNARHLQLKGGQALVMQHYITVVRPQLLAAKPSGQLKEPASLLTSRSRVSDALKAKDVIAQVLQIGKKIYPGRGLSAQKIRQSVIANLLKQGHDISVVQAFAGHRSPDSTKLYSQERVAGLQAAVAACHPLQ